MCVVYCASYAYNIIVVMIANVRGCMYYVYFDEHAIVIGNVKSGVPKMNFASLVPRLSLLAHAITYA